MFFSADVLQAQENEIEYNGRCKLDKIYGHCFETAQALYLMEGSSIDETIESNCQANSAVSAVEQQLKLVTSGIRESI